MVNIFQQHSQLDFYFKKIDMRKFGLVIILSIIVRMMFAQDFEVSPVLMNFNAEPGEIQKKQLTLINHSAQPQKYNLKISDFILDADGNRKVVPLGSSKRSCADWINITPSFIELNPNQTAQLDVMMTVPKDGFSSRWCMVHVEVAKEQTAFEADKTLATGVLLVPRIVVMIKQSPRSNSNYKATISGLKEITKKSDKSQIFEVLVSNVGDNVIDANVYLQLANLQTGKEEKFNIVKTTIYPDASRKITLQIPRIAAKGKYVLGAILDYGHRQPLGGTQLMLEIK
ncbi:MAG: hypothetical protein ACOYM7_07145 [Paludibacter sp.]